MHLKGMQHLDVFLFRSKLVLSLLSTPTHLYFSITFSLLFFLHLSTSHHHRHPNLLFLLLSFLFLSTLISAGRGNRGRTSHLAPNSPPLHCSNVINSTGGNRRGELEKFLINPIKQVHGLQSVCVCVCVCVCVQTTVQTALIMFFNVHTHTHGVLLCLRLKMKLFMVDHISRQRGELDIPLCFTNFRASQMDKVPLLVKQTSLFNGFTSGVQL